MSRPCWSATTCSFPSSPTAISPSRCRSACRCSTAGSSAAAEARRRRRVQAAARQPHRLHQADHRPARRPDPGEHGVLYINGKPVERKRIAIRHRAMAVRRAPNTARPCRRRQLQRPGPRARRPARQHAGLQGAAGPLLRDGRQPRQLRGQPGAGPRGVGFVPFENLVGRAEIIFFSIKTEPGGGSSGNGRGRPLEPAVHLAEGACSDTTP